MNSATKQALANAVIALDGGARTMTTEQIVLMVYNLGRIDEQLGLGEERADKEIAQQGVPS